MSIPINEAVLPAIAMVEFNDGTKEKITIHTVETDGYWGKIYGKKKVGFFLKGIIKNIIVQYDQLSVEQRRVLNELKNGDATAAQLGCSLSTLSTLQSFELAKNIQEFGTSKIQGKERTEIYWKYIGRN